MQHVDVDKHRRDEAPPLIIRRIDQVIKLGPVHGEDRVREAALQNSERHPARFPHQQKHEQVYDEKNNRELVRTIQDGARKPDRFFVRRTWSSVSSGLGCG